MNVAETIEAIAESLTHPAESIHEHTDETREYIITNHLNSLVHCLGKDIRVSMIVGALDEDEIMGVSLATREDGEIKSRQAAVVYGQQMADLLYKTEEGKEALREIGVDFGEDEDYAL